MALRSRHPRRLGVSYPFVEMRLSNPWSQGYRGRYVNINQIIHFLDVARTGSVNRTALNLYISPQGISRSIAQLEKSLGFDLFYRSPQGMALTEEDQAFLEPAEKILQDYNEFLGAVSTLSVSSAAKSSAAFNLQAPPLLTITSSLETILANIQERYPSMQVDVTERNSIEMEEYAEGISDDLLRRTCMVATVPDYEIEGYLSSKRFALTKICEFPVIVRVREGHPFATRKSVTRAELAQERIVSFNEPIIDDIVHHLLDDYGGPHFAFKGSVRNLLERFPDAVLVSSGGVMQADEEGVKNVHIEDTVRVHMLAITASPVPPVVRGVLECIQAAYR